MSSGAYNCSCDEGYEGDGFNCTDIDECLEGLDNCDANAYCTNTDGSFECECMFGWFGDGVSCIDSDECAILDQPQVHMNVSDPLYDSNMCSENGFCTNTEGAYNCTCNDGYEGDGFNCTNIDECAEGTDECSEFADCTDTDGSYNCTCWLGYDGDGFNCTEVDECLNAINELRSMAPPELVGEFSYCAEDAICTNTDGGYNCTCEYGFYGNGFICTDSDECGHDVMGVDENGDEDDLWNTNDCHSNATCSNFAGGYNCTCEDGYRGDGFNCTEIDECAEMTDDCSENAQCINLPGTFTCECNDGYRDMNDTVPGKF